jgi:hypothetical protein
MSDCFLDRTRFCDGTCQAHYYPEDDRGPVCAFIKLAMVRATHIEKSKKDLCGKVTYPASPPAPEVR